MCGVELEVGQSEEQLCNRGKRRIFASKGEKGKDWTNSEQLKTWMFFQLPVGAPANASAGNCSDLERRRWSRTLKSPIGGRSPQLARPGSGAREARPLQSGQRASWPLGWVKFHSPRPMDGACPASQLKHSEGSVPACAQVDESLSPSIY